MPLKKLPDLAHPRPACPPSPSPTRGNLFGALEFSETAAKAGVQPIIGLQFPLAYATPRTPRRRRRPSPRPIVLLAQNETGYLNLLKLSSCHFLDSGEALPHITLA